jgi:Fur family ferric uptake transcriptional regulator
MNQKSIDRLKQVLRKENLKFTPQRLAILEEVLSSDEHRECEDIYYALKQKGVNSSRATVYRTMDILCEYDFARKLEFGDGRARYENKENSEHHDHLVCTDCGSIIEFVDEIIEKQQEELCKSKGFKLTRHIHQLFGLCKDCQ